MYDYASDHDQLDLLLRWDRGDAPFSEAEPLVVAALKACRLG
jgi:hypothetical protein